MTAETMGQSPTVGTHAHSGDYWRQFAVIVATLATIAINTLAVTLPLNGRSTGEISDSFPVLFTPAGYVFSIWSLIYLGLIAYTVYQALPAQRTNPRVRGIGWLYVISGVANSVWIFLWHYEQFIWTLVAMVVLLISLIEIYRRLTPTRREVGRAEWWTTHLTFSIYLGWITVATVANATTLLYYLGWNGGGIAPELWTVIMLSVATVLGLIIALRYQDVGYVAVLVWAFLGIYVKQSANPMLAWTAVGLAAVLAVVVVTAALRARRAALAG